MQRTQQSLPLVAAIHADEPSAVTLGFIVISQFRGLIKASLILKLLCNKLIRKSQSVSSRNTTQIWVI